MAGGFEYLARRQGQIDHGVLAGRNEHGARVHLAEAERAVHTYVCGVSGSGKSRFLQNLLFQDISKGHPVCLIDPMGDLYRSALDYMAASIEQSGALGFGRRELLPRYLFLDATDPDNPLRINPLEAHPDETSEQAVDDLMKALERLFEGRLEEQRRLRNVLRAAFMTIAELNRLPPEERPLVGGLTAETYPLQLVHAADLLNLPDEQRRVLLAALPGTLRLRFHEQYWQFLGQSPPRERTQLLQSSWNVLQYLLADDLVLRVFDVQHSTLRLAEVLRSGQSLFCHLPKHENLAGARFLGKYLTTKLQHAAYRRPEAEWNRPCHLYLDEFHQFVDQAFADGMTNLRKFGLRVTNAHQSQTQPPFDTAEGQSLLRTITANSRIKVLFRLDRPDAERMSRELFELTQRRRNFTAIDHTESRSEQRSRSVGRSSGHSAGSDQRAGTSVMTDRNSLRRDEGRSERSEYSTGEQTTEGETTGTSRAATRREIYYTLEGERELLVNALQRLADRCCLLSTGSLEAQVIETPFVPDSAYACQAEDLPAALIEAQRERILGPERVVRLEPVRLLPAASHVEVEVPVAETESPVLDLEPEKEERMPVFAPVVRNEDDPFLD